MQPDSSLTTRASVNPENVSTKARERIAKVPFERAALLLCPWSNAAPLRAYWPGRYARLIELLEGRAAIGALQGWRFGRRQAPQWAKDMLANHLEREIAERAEAIRLLREKKKPAEAGS